MDFYYMAASAPCRSVLMLAQAMGIELNKKPTNPTKGETQTPEFLELNPQHTIPTLVDGDFSIWESRAIMIYLVEEYGKTDSLYPKDLKERAMVNQRLFFDLGTLIASFSNYYYPQFLTKAPGDPEKYKKIEEAFGFLNSFLEGQTYAVGDTLTVADFALVASVSSFKVLGFDISKYKNVQRWYENCERALPGFKENWEGCLELKSFFNL